MLEEHKYLQTSFSMPVLGGSIIATSKVPFLETHDFSWSSTHFSPLTPKLSCFVPTKFCSANTRASLLCSTKVTFSNLSARNTEKVPAPLYISSAFLPPMPSVSFRIVFSRTFMFDWKKPCTSKVIFLPHKSIVQILFWFRDVPSKRLMTLLLPFIVFPFLRSSFCDSFS